MVSYQRYNVMRCKQVQTGLFCGLHSTDCPDWVIGFFFVGVCTVVEGNVQSKLRGIIFTIPKVITKTLAHISGTPQPTPISILRWAEELTIQKSANPPYPRGARTAIGSPVALLF